MSEALDSIGARVPEAYAPGAGTQAKKRKTPKLVKPLATWQMWVGLVALTALGAFLRYWRLDFQAYWTDEGYTIERVRLTFPELLRSIEQAGFPPGWHALIRWWRLILEQFMPAAETYQPHNLRAFPALLGTLTVPAMYFLARQFTDRKGALLVTLLAAVNPFLIYYARDIKMYAALMFFVTINMALFLEWQSSRRHWLWFPLYALSGVAMTLMHPMAFFVPGLQLVFLLTRPRPRGFDAPLWVLAAGLAAAIPYYWFGVYVPQVLWERRLDSQTDAGLGWVTSYTDMSWRTVASLPLAHILGYLWPVYPPDARIDNWFMLGGADFKNHLTTRSWPWMVQAQIWGAVGLFTIMAAGLIPWRGIRRSSERDASATRGRWWWVLLWIAVPMMALALTWVPGDFSWFRGVWDQQFAASWKLWCWGGLLSHGLLWLGILSFRFWKTRRAISSGGILAKQESDESVVRGCWWWAKFWIVLTVVGFAIKWSLRDDDWFWRMWSDLKIKPLWEPRWLCMIVPAWLLWLGASLRRIPTIWVRVPLIIAVAGACGYSSMSNHLILRNAPMHRGAEVVEKYIDNKNRFATAVAFPMVKYEKPTWSITPAIARHVVPGSREDQAYHPYTNDMRRSDYLWPTDLETPQQVVNWVRTQVMNNPRVNTLVLTDRFGDLTEEKELLSDKYMEKLLGPRWERVYADSYKWHYEWRFYIFHTWRTRVWKLKG